MKIKYFENGIKVTFRVGKQIKTICGTPTHVWLEVSKIINLNY